MAIPIAFIGFNDLGRPVTPIYPLSKNEQKISVGSLKKFEYFCPRDMESCHFAAARRVKLWSLNANLFFEEPNQLTKFA